MRGPLLSGPLGSQPALEALARWVGTPDAPIVVLGPPWMGASLARGGDTLLLVEREVRPQALRALRRARKESRPLQVAMAAAELPFARGALSAVVVENVTGLAIEEAQRWIASLTPLLRPNGRLIAADATSSDDAAARVAGAFLSSALTNIVQEWPREGAVLTVGTAAQASVVAARFDLSA
jgi:hypothetical protein